MRLSPHLSFNGTCHEAFSFYENVLNGKIVTMLTYGESPMSTNVQPDWHEKIIHATLMLHDGVLSGADLPPEQYELPRGFQILYQPETPQESRRVFDALAEGGKVVIPVQNTFWSPCYGALVDKFNIPWEISCESDDSTETQLPD
ncbi:MAG: VOC family protein [Gammaproteobacteria bacterium]|nr:VOC family protein [Gammaproteobacteria bacterium]